MVVATAGLLDIVSAVTPPLRVRLAALHTLVPLVVPQTADALVAFTGVALLLVGRGLRHGQRRAWTFAVVALTLSIVLHVIKGVDIEEAAGSALAAGYLFFRRAAFKAPSDAASFARSLVIIVLTAASVVGLATGFLMFGPVHLAFEPALVAASARLLGITSTRLPERINDFLWPALLASGAGLAAAVGFTVFRPVVSATRLRRALPSRRAFDIVSAHGGGTLDYFALRSDKEHFIWHDTLIAYAVFGTVCLVSPDPIGPSDQRVDAWTTFRHFADQHGWTTAVLGAGEEWLSVYRDFGMRTLYMGDEGVVDVHAFSLDGGRMKGLRHVVNRMRRHGYRVEFFDPAFAAPELKAELRYLMTKSRRGECERGFSMTLGRAFDAADRGLLLAVAFDRDDLAVAFCQFVPAQHIDGYSLDLMRRDDGEHPNGLLDFIILETIRRLRTQGRGGLALNFATFRAVVAGEAGESMGLRVRRWFLLRMSDSMQIESLWRFNAKYFPTWRPRYAVYDSVEQFMSSAMAVARAESFWELPVLGRFLTPDEDDNPAEERTLDTCAS